ncbi:MAG: hypothetical protein GF405_10555 [Candidatus Eisenbacteria bacterium]|nr:hypothetical protein [Candidatus Eisenbacteria bacterium]
MRLRADTTRLGGESGATLAVVTMLGLVMLITAAAVYQFGAQDASLASRDLDRSRALYLAEAGLQRAHTWLEAQTDPPAGVSLIEPFGSTPDTMGAGTYYTTILPDASNPGMSRKYYTITSTATVDSETRTVEREVMTQSFAQFIYFTEEEHLPGSVTPVWFCSADAIDGAIHTNGQVHIMGDPLFDGHLSSAHGGPDDPDTDNVPSFMYYNGNYWNHLESSAPSNEPYDSPTFGDGYELGTTAIGLPEYLDDIEAMAQSGGLHIDGDTEIVIGREGRDGPMYGTVSYRPDTGGDWTDVDISSFNGVLFVNGDADVSGILDGSLTVATGGDMYIVDDVTYRGADPIIGPLEGCDDILGLVSQQNVYVKDNAANASSCNIHAHIMALDTSFQVENYRYGSPRGTLTVHGGIIQRYRGAVGTGYLQGDSVVISTGFAKNYHYDRRFDMLQPPGYFLTGKYYELEWREV